MRFSPIEKDLQKKKEGSNMSSTWRSYVSHMTQRDMFDFSASLLATIVIGTGIIYVIWRIVNRKQLAAKPTIPRRAAVVAKQAAVPSSAKKVEPGDAGGVDAAPASGLPTPPEGFVRRIPRGAQAALVERGQRLLSEKNFDQAMVCFLSLLYSTSEGGGGSKDDRILPTHLTECLRGAAQCFRATGQNELAVKFLQAERRVFEEMVVQAANPEGAKKGTSAESILGSLLGRSGAKGGVGRAEELPKRCFTLDEVSDACTKLGYHDVALAYRVKSAALKSKITGKPLDPESDEAAQLARAIGEFRSRHPTNAGGGGNLPDGDDDDSSTGVAGSIGEQVASDAPITEEPELAGAAPLEESTEVK